MIKYIFHFINNIYWLNVAFYTYFFVYCIAEIVFIALVIGVSLLGMVEWTVMCSRDGNLMAIKISTIYEFDNTIEQSNTTIN